MELLNTAKENESFPKKRNFNFTPFLIITIVLIALNIAAGFLFEMQGLRVVRIATTLIFFIGFLSLRLKHKRLFSIILALILLSDVGLFNYENKWFCFLRFVTYIIMNLLLSYHLFNKSFFKKLKPFALAVIFVIFLSCVFLIENLAQLIDFTVFGRFHEFLYYFYTLTTFLLVFLTVVYNLNEYSKKMDVFLATVVAFLASDILLMIGYYEDLYIVIQIERFFQIMAIALLIYYVVLFDESKRLKIEN